MWIQIHLNYDICIDGNVRNRKTGRILKQWTMGQYLGIWLGTGNKQYIHRLVATAFLPTPTEEGLWVDHIDRNKYNNHASNLRWVNPTINGLNKTCEVNARKNSKLQELYITPDRKTYRVCIARLNVSKGFKTFDEAKQFRDTILNASKNCKERQ